MSNCQALFLLCGIFAGALQASSKEVDSYRQAVVNELQAIQSFASEKAYFFQYEYEKMRRERDPSDEFFLDIFANNAQLMRDVWQDSEKILVVAQQESLWWLKIRLQLLRNRLYAYYADTEELKERHILRRSEGLTAKTMGYLSCAGSILVKASSVFIAVKSVYDLWPSKAEIEHANCP